MPSENRVVKYQWYVNYSWKNTPIIERNGLKSSHQVSNLLNLSLGLCSQEWAGSDHLHLINRLGFTPHARISRSVTRTLQGWSACSDGPQSNSQSCQHFSLVCPSLLPSRCWLPLRTIAPLLSYYRVLGWELRNLWVYGIIWAGISAFRQCLYNTGGTYLFVDRSHCLVCAQRHHR